MSLEFLITSLVVVLLPGTGVIYTLAIGLGRGFRPSMAAAFGCTMGIVPAALASIVGLAALMHSSALAFQAIKLLGAMVAMELFKDTARKVPDPDLTKALVALAAERGLILLSCGMYGNTIRVLVPITGADALIDEGLDIIEGCLDTLTAK